MKNILLVLCVLIAACSHGPSPAGVNTDPTTGLAIPATYTFQHVTKGGVFIQANTTVPEFAEDAIDTGISTQIEKAHAAHPEWPAGKNLNEYELIFINPMATNAVDDPGSPAILVNGQQAAGTCIGAYGTRMIIVLPHQIATSWSHLDYLRESARNESEHIELGFLNNNAKELFDYYQGQNDVHPIFK